MEETLKRQAGVLEVKQIEWMNAKAIVVMKEGKEFDIAAANADFGDDFQVLSAEPIKNS